MTIRKPDRRSDYNFDLKKLRQLDSFRLLIVKYELRIRLPVQESHSSRSLQVKFKSSFNFEGATWIPQESLVYSDF